MTVLIGAGILFLLAAVVGAPVVSQLKSQSSDFQDPAAQNQQVLRAIERATGQSADFGVAALVPTDRRSASTDVRSDPAAAGPARRVASLLSHQAGFQRALDYPATHLPALVSRDGRETVVLAAFATRDRSVAAVDRVRRALAGSGVRLGGNDIAFHEINQRTTSDLSRAEMFAFPILLLGFSPIGGLEESNLVLLFVVAFALSTDYGVFLFSRIKESHDEGMSTRAAVAHGLERTGRLVTAAALLFCVAIGAFVTSHIFFIKEFGLGTALAVAIDASVVRALLVPAIMGKLGERSWWAPRSLRRLYERVGPSETPSLGKDELGGAHA